MNDLDVLLNIAIEEARAALATAKTELKNAQYAYAMELFLSASATKQGVDRQTELRDKLSTAFFDAKAKVLHAGRRVEWLMWLKPHLDSDQSLRESLQKELSLV